jgi:hypothetical protein
MEPEAEIARAALSELTHAPFVITAPRQYDLGKNPKWYVTCLDGSYFEKTAHADTVWADQEGKVWLESTHLGSPTSWAEETYGERGGNQVMDMRIDYRHLTLAQIQTRLKGLPKVHDRIENYRQIAAEVSGKTGIPIEMVFDAKADLGWFLFRARLSPKAPSDFDKLIHRTITAMKEVYDRTESKLL